MWNKIPLLVKDEGNRHKMGKGWISVTARVLNVNVGYGYERQCGLRVLNARHDETAEDEEKVEIRIQRLDGKWM